MELQLRHPCFRPDGAADAERAVFLPPDHQRGDVDAAIAEIERVPVPQQRAVVIDHPRQRAGAGGGGGIDIEHVLAEAALVDGHVVERPADRLCAVLTEHTLRQAGELEEEDIPAFPKLREGPRLTHADHRVRHIHDDELGERADLGDGKGPGDDRAPIMRDQHHLIYRMFSRRQIDEGANVCREMIQRIRPHTLRLV